MNVATGEYLLTKFVCIVGTPISVVGIIGLFDTNVIKTCFPILTTYKVVVFVGVSVTTFTQALDNVASSYQLSVEDPFGNLNPVLGIDTSSSR